MKHHQIVSLIASTIVMSGIACGAVDEAAGNPASPVSDYNVVWNSPSADCNGSMPIGNGDIGANVWVEDNGDLCFYISKTDAWDEHARLLKLGKIRVSLSPNPFAKGCKFKQELDLRSGVINLSAAARNPDLSADLRFWIDANHPAIRITGTTSASTTVNVVLEHWRTECTQASWDWSFSGLADRTLGRDTLPYPIFLEPDTILAGRSDSLVWYHRNRKNEHSVWADTLTVQGLGDFMAETSDPLLDLTFGALVRGDGMVGRSPTALQSGLATTNIDISVFALTSQTATAEDWIKQVEAQAAAYSNQGPGSAWTAHQRWWNQFWDQSWIHIDAKPGDDAFIVARGYALQNWMTACGGRGNMPIKFNGSIFTVDGIFNGQDKGPDYRRWGPAYWWQNTRLPYWPMFAAGHYEILKPLFKMYLDALPLARHRVKQYYDFDGAYFPETMYFWGAYRNEDYGWHPEKDKKPDEIDNKFIQYYWQGGIELTAMMLQYYHHTQDRGFLNTSLLPFAKQITSFYDQRYPRDGKGKLVIHPGNALEEVWACTNPAPEIAGLRFILPQLMELAANTEDKQGYARLLKAIPELPRSVSAEGKEFLLPAATGKRRSNCEKPECYAIFPYRLFGVGLPGLELARETFRLSPTSMKGQPRSNGWVQDSIFAACVGDGDAAKRMLVERSKLHDKDSRFPAFWGPNFDWTPDQDHGGVNMIALQRMLMQTEPSSPRIHLCPAWPKDWDCSFKLHAPGPTVIQGRVKSGKVIVLVVTPESRKKDIVIHLTEGAQTGAASTNGFPSANLHGGSPDSRFTAYYTRMNPSPVGHIGKYEDLVVTLGQGNRLEFARANGYQPQWRTASGIYRVENLIPNTTEDPNCFYSYVRLMEAGAEKIVVQWRRFRDPEGVAKVNEALEPLNPHGITGVIHELFTISPDGRVEREVRDAENTRYQDWIDPRLATRQILQLTDTGIEHGPVNTGQKPPIYPRAPINGNPVKAYQSLPAPIHYWSFDEGMAPHEDKVEESVSRADCEITGLMTQFKKGVSGAALALDGYYTGVTMDASPASHQALTVTAWVALDTYPYNNAPLVHQSKVFGAEGWYLGLDAYGHPFVTVAGQTVKASATVLPLYQWTQVCATIGAGKICLYIDGREVASGDFNEEFTTPATPLLFGRNNEAERNTDPVRGPKHNLEVIYGIQGLLDEVSIHDQALSPREVQRAYTGVRPADRISDLAKGVLPGELGTARRFGAAYKSLPVSDVWDQLWRDLPGADIMVKFDNNPCSVIFWRGTNHAANWVTDNNRWMTDQSSENGGPHGCSEHMADKQNRHCRSAIIENTPARVMIHWRYPCVDVSYKNLKAGAWTDEYHTIYPDGTGVRQVVWNGANGGYGPAFQDIQILTNPGETALDVMNLQAMDLANLKGETLSLTWTLPNGVPKNTLADATIEVVNSKSENKVFAMFLGGYINPWGAREQSKYLVDPFPGMWNHWPMHLVPSDGRFAVAADRVTHFSLAANDASNKFGSVVLYGFTRQPIGGLVPLARSWSQPPDITAISGCKTDAYRKESRDFPLFAEKETMSVRIAATGESPLVNPCFTVRNWGHSGPALVTTTGTDSKDVRQGVIIDADGTRTMVVWLELAANSPVTVAISGAKPNANYNQ